MTNLDSILKSRDITLPTKVCLVKAIYCHPAYLTYMQSTLLFESFQEVLLKLFIVNNHRYLHSEKMGGGRIKG